MRMTNWRDADPALRLELEGVLAQPGVAFHSELGVQTEWRLFVLFASIGAVSALLWFIAADVPAPSLALHRMSLPGGLTGAALLKHAGACAMVVLLAAGAWAAGRWVPGPGRDGLAITSAALVVVRGRRLGILPWSQVELATRIPASLGRRIVVLSLRTSSGATYNFTATGAWVDEALRHLVAARCPAPADVPSAIAVRLDVSAPKE